MALFTRAMYREAAVRAKQHFNYDLETRTTVEYIDGRPEGRIQFRRTGGVVPCFASPRAIMTQLIGCGLPVALRRKVVQWIRDDRRGQA